MKRKIVIALVLGIIAATTGVSSVVSKPQIAYAQSIQAEQKTAKLGDVKVSFDGKVVTIQAYNIDGYNYVRARDITNQLNMMVDAYSQDGDIGIGIYSTIPATVVAPTDKLTEKTISVTLTQGYVFYDGSYVKTECFLYNGRYYFKVADIGDAAQGSLDGKIITTAAKGKAPNGLAPTPARKDYTSITVEWDSATQTIHVNKVVTDLQKVFDNARAGNDVASTADTKTKSSVSAEKSTPTPTVKAQPELTTAPEESKTLANILIDPNKGAVDGNFTYPYTIHSQRGQCTWYATGRFYEVTGINTANRSGGNYLNGTELSKWVEKAMTDDCPDIKGIPYIGGQLTDIPSRGLAVWDGHVIFIEYGEHDSNGAPTYIYYSEANAGHDGEKYEKGVFYPGRDGIVSKMEAQDLLLQPGTFYGFVVAN